MTVPAAVPSLVQSSVPCAPSEAAKNRVPFKLMRLVGEEPTPPGLISATMDVPAAVPSLIQSSFPCEPSLAEKNRAPFTTVRELGEELNTRLVTMRVPDGVPSL